MTLNEVPEIVTLPSAHYVHVRKIGPFSDTARAAWQQFHAALPTFPAGEKATRYFSLYRMEPEMIYLAGIDIEAEPEEGSLPDGYEYIHFSGGKYLQYTLTGPYDQLPVAVGRAFDLMKASSTELRDDYCGEAYANNPASTAPEDLITHILFPLAE